MDPTEDMKPPEEQLSTQMTSAHFREVLVKQGEREREEGQERVRGRSNA